MAGLERAFKKPYLMGNKNHRGVLYNLHVGDEVAVGGVCIE